MVSTEAPVMMTVPEVAKAIGASPIRVYALITEGKIPGIRIGRRVRVPRPAFDQWVSNLSAQALAGLKDAAPAA